ncbi:MAG: hypothetical protein QN175_10655 [Armatimonadota bacterium]|nr:hypothetical protein [Armatimonadota bacterium]MDR7469501.1 hypothetical protein [Armatimonadota bacterium]MDR7475452.1 hypothetical protein [Armatimonadota bacterium]
MQDSIGVGFFGAPQGTTVYVDGNETSRTQLPGKEHHVIAHSAAADDRHGLPWLHRSAHGQRVVRRGDGISEDGALFEWNIRGQGH